MTEHCPNCGDEVNGSVYCTWACFQDDENAEKRVREYVNVDMGSGE